MFEISDEADVYKFIIIRVEKRQDGKIKLLKPRMIEQILYIKSFISLTKSNLISQLSINILQSENVWT